MTGISAEYNGSAVPVKAICHVQNGNIDKKLCAYV